MIISFTGTRAGMTPQQLERVKALMTEYKPDSICHGDCVGADEQFHELAVLWGIKHVSIRPGHDRRGRTPTRAHCHLSGLTQSLGVECTVYEPAPYLGRDGIIAGEGDLLIATPKGYNEEWRGSGTWSTIRQAARHYKPVCIVYPDGSVGGYVARQEL